MNTLERYFELQKATDQEKVAAMNYLGNFGIISDNAIEPKDVAEFDAVRAVEFLMECQP